MADEDCVFCRIAMHQSPAQIEYEDENFIVFHDINPSAPIHLLIIPKTHFSWQDDLSHQSKILGRIFQIAPKMAEKMEIKDTGYKLIMNCGRGAGQIIEHFNVHLIGGWQPGTVRKLP
ncbi:MAG: HIT domain-containing protein [Candidatus Cloacimonetes bacterium]|nr:HIT domain-containing protein [Candidatus Cloacimonadota bacterium]